MSNTATQSPPPSPVTPPDDDPATLAASFDHCRHVTRTRARNFYYGLKLTPEPKRSALYAIYAFMRACDDLADDPLSPSPADTRRQIEAFRSHMTAVLSTPKTSPARKEGVQPPPTSTSKGGVDERSERAGGESSTKLMWPAFRHTMLTYPIDPTLMHDMLDGQLRDLDPAGFETFDDLYDYCYKVASVVGLTCICVWGYTGGEPTRKLAEYRGIAFQLTNILRDLTEDAQRNRVYLPTDDLTEFGFTPDSFRAQILDRRTSPNLKRLIARQADRALDYYQRAATLESFIDPACRPTSLAVMRIYRGLLNKIIRRPDRVLTERVRLTKIHKVVIALTASHNTYAH